MSNINFSELIIIFCTIPTIVILISTLLDVNYNYYRIFITDFRAGMKELIVYANRPYRAFISKMPSLAKYGFSLLGFLSLLPFLFMTIDKVEAVQAHKYAVYEKSYIIISLFAILLVVYIIFSFTLRIIEYIFDYSFKNYVEKLNMKAYFAVSNAFIPFLVLFTEVLRDNLTILTSKIILVAVSISHLQLFKGMFEIVKISNYSDRKHGKKYLAFIIWGGLLITTLAAEVLLVSKIYPKTEPGMIMSSVIAISGFIFVVMFVGDLFSKPEDIN